MEKNQVIKREFRVEGIRLREAEEGKQSRTITGYAIVFNSPYVMYEDKRDVLREVISPSAITREVLDSNDFVMTMFHNDQLVLARAKNGEGTLRYDVDEKGVSFEFDAPHTADGDKALELVKRGDIDGCSFAFTTEDDNEEYVSCKSETVDGKIVTTYSVNKVTGLYDFTLTPRPAYGETECSCRDLVKRLRDKLAQDDVEELRRRELVKKQVAEMRAAMKF